MAEAARAAVRGPVAAERVAVADRVTAAISAEPGGAEALGMVDVPDATDAADLTDTTNRPSGSLAGATTDPRDPAASAVNIALEAFNSSLMREMRAIAFVTSLIERGKLDEKEARRMHIHSIRADEEMANLSATSKLNADWAFLCELHDRGRAHAEQWLGHHFDAIGVRSSVDLRTEIL